MYLKEKYDSVGQRIAAYYLTVMKPVFSPVRGVYLSYYKQIYDFLWSLYLMLYEHPELLGFKISEDNCLDACDSSEKERKFCQNFLQNFRVFYDFLYFLYQTGFTGFLEGHNLVADIDLYEGFMQSYKRMKERLITGVSMLGLEIRKTDRGVLISNLDQPEMIVGLQMLASLCNKKRCESGFFCFYRCDLDVMENGYKPQLCYIMEDLIRFNDSYVYIKMLVEYMKKNGYTFRFAIENQFILTLYCSHGKIKRTPLVVSMFDIRYKSMLRISLKFVNTNKIVPLLKDAPAYVRKNFYEISNVCRGDQCKMYGKLKGNEEPVLLQTNQGEKSICRLLQEEYTMINKSTYLLIKHYLILHHRLINLPE